MVFSNPSSFALGWSRPPRPLHPVPPSRPSAAASGVVPANAQLNLFPVLGPCHLVHMFSKNGPSENRTRDPCIQCILISTKLYRLS